MTPEQAKKKEVLWQACSHIETDYVPKSVIASNGMLDFAGVTYAEAENNTEVLEKVFRKFLSSAPFDVGMFSLQGSPKAYEALNNRTETFLSYDGVTLQHYQKPTMKDDEYPLLIEDMESFMRNVLFPRKYPELFEDRQKAMETLRTVVDEQAARNLGPYEEVRTRVCAEHDFLPYPGGLPRFSHPADFIFDRFRGFRGTLSDLRRRPEQFKAACDMIWEIRSSHFEDLPMTELFASYMPHIPCYLSPKQYYEFFFPYFKVQATNIGNSGNKTYLSLEGRWLPFVESFLDLPKDATVIFVDDDDVLEVNKVIGHHQVLTGGVKLQNIRLGTKQTNIDYAKKIIDEMAPGGGYIFNLDKACVCKGDINQNLFDVYLFANEYARK
ncbi:MAG: hypothetical protein FWG10_12890 [Eubacteriaceae bacterium]|nr:hypothetical protein [Eubacteriaceae bacterium]